MGKNKLKKWAENKTLPNVFEPNLLPIIHSRESFMKGKWREKVFGNANPIVLELGCGKGEYTVELAKMFSEKNFIGIDVKGHRFHKGAKESFESGLLNVAFLRTRIEFIESFFDTNEVNEIWLTFSDPMPKDEKGNRRITSLHYINMYKNFLAPGSQIHIKHDNPLVYDLTFEELESTLFPIESLSDDLYSGFMNLQTEEWKKILSIRTHYENIWLSEGRKVKYIRFRIP